MKILQKINMEVILIILYIIITGVLISCAKDDFISSYDDSIYGIWEYSTDDAHYQLWLEKFGSFIFRVRYYNSQQWHSDFGNYTIEDDNIYLNYNNKNVSLYKYYINDNYLYLENINKKYKLHKHSSSI